MTSSILNVRSAFVVFATLALITGCSSGGGGGASPVSPSSVQGIATPSSISVVTANNAN